MSPRTRTDTTTVPPTGGDPLEWTITIPQAADWMSLNDRDHWAPRARAVRSWRAAALIAARAARLPKLERAHLDITFHKTTRRSYDVHNLMPTAKAIVDGLVGTPRHPGYGLLPDDDNAHLTGPDLHAGEVRAKPCVVVRIRADRGRPSSRVA